MSKKKITLLSYDFSNLKEKTVFDYTDDKEVLCNILRTDGFLPTGSQLVDFRKYCKTDFRELGLHYRSLYHIIKDEYLLYAIHLQFTEDELNYGYE